MTYTGCRRRADVRPPSISCPNDIEVIVPEWGHNGTTIYYDAQKPTIDDNSDVHSYRILGAPDDRMFPVGITVLTYEAFDEAGNSRSCTRYVRVRGEVMFRLVAFGANELFRTT